MKENWLEILDQCIDDARGKPFVWGKHDCCMFAADTVLAMTGTDYAKEFRGKYKTRRGAAKVLKHKSLSDTMDSKLPPTMNPTRGDVVIALSKDGTDALGICLGRISAFIDDELGLVFVSTLDVHAAWSVAHV